MSRLIGLKLLMRFFTGEETDCDYRLSIIVKSDRLLERLLLRFVRFNRHLSHALARKFPGTFSAKSYGQVLKERIKADLAQRSGVTVLEVGGIDRPLLKKNPAFRYHGMDIESKERCFELYDEFLVQSIEKAIAAKYQMIISTTLLEHVPNNAAAVQDMYQGLTPGGVMHHFIPSKNHPYSICLRLVGPRLQQTLIRYLRPDSVATTGYPAFFNHCSPREMEDLFQRAGFVEIHLQHFYRANDYFAFFVPLYVLITLYENICKYFDLRALCSGFIISAKHPE